MIIDLFIKNQGFNYLKDVYCINNDIIEELQKCLYTYCDPAPMMNEEEADAFIRNCCFTECEEEKQRIKQNLIRKHPAYWQPVENAIEIFLEKTNIKLDSSDLSTLRFHCIHVSPSIDGGESIKKYGLLKLNELLEIESPISTFLKEYGIIIKPSEKWYSIKGKKHSVVGTGLAIKLYSFNNEIEAHIAGETKELKDYSCIEENPEFLRELSPLCGIDLQAKWAERKNALLYVSFNLSFDECANITHMSCMQEPDNYERFKPFIKGVYDFGNEPISIWRNLWLIDACIDNSCPGKSIELSPMAVNADVRLDSSRIDVMLV